MSTELTVLVAAGGLSLLLALATIVVHLKTFGGAAIRSSREAYPALGGLAGRVVRAHANLNEALLPFAIVVLAAAMLHLSTPWTTGAAMLFLAARIAHASLYVAGIPMLRSLAYYVGLGATVLLAAQLPLISLT
jgi:uncharacterized MAPEG superfamily protein